MQEPRPFVPEDFKFRPSDEELIGYYLHRKVSGMPIPYLDCVIKECDLYGEHEPGVIWNSCGGTLLNEDEDLYFFTKLKKMNPKSSRINRKVGSGVGAGAWQGEDAPTEIVSRKTQKLIGSKKRFRYEKNNSEDDGLWIMHEYTLDSSLLGQNQSTNYVLCRIRKNEPTGSRKGKRLGLAKKRKLRDFQNRSNQSECQSSEISMVTMVQQVESCNTDMMSKQSFQTIEASGIDYTSVSGAGQHEVTVGVVLPDQTTQILTIDSVSFAEQHEAPAAVEPDHQIVTLQLENSSDDHPLIGMSEEDLSMLRKMFSADDFDSQPVGETGPSASIDWMTMPYMQEMFCELPKIMPEEFPSDDGESAGNTSSSVDKIRNQQRLSDHGCACDGEGILQISKIVAVVPMAFPDLSVGVFGEITNSVADIVMMEQEISTEDCEVLQQLLFEENHQEEEEFFQENFTNLIYL